MLLDKRADLPKSPLGLVRREELVKDLPPKAPLELVKDLPPTASLELVKDLALGLVGPFLLSVPEKLVRTILDLRDTLGLEVKVAELLWSCSLWELTSSVVVVVIPEG